MESPFEASRLGIERDFRDARTHNPHPLSLIARGAELPVQRDRQVDAFLFPAVAAGGGSSATVYPFDVISAGTANLQLVQPGTINGLLPSNYNSLFTTSPTSTYYVTLTCTAANGQITGATLSFAASAPAAIPTNMGQPPTSFAFLLGLFTNGVWVRTIGDGSLSAASQFVMETSKTSPAPGTLPYDNWYTWLIGLA